MQDGKECKLYVQWAFQVLPQTKRIYLIRHGESEWNEEEAVAKNTDKNRTIRERINALKRMKATNDHPLNHEGIIQARKLYRSWRTASTDRNDPDVQRFLSEDNFILTSPLTRAVETCLLSLGNHPAISKGVFLYRQIRERKNIMGFDTKGIVTGRRIKKRVRKVMEENMHLHSNFGRDERAKFCNRICNVPLFEHDCTDGSGIWWTKKKDTDGDMEERREDFINLIANNEFDTFICSGHSLFWKELMKGNMKNGWKWEEICSCGKSSYDAGDEDRPECKACDENGIIDLEKCKMKNGSCCYIDIDCSSPDLKEWKIIKCKTMFNYNGLPNVTETTSEQLSASRMNELRMLSGRDADTFESKIYSSFYSAEEEMKTRPEDWRFSESERRQPERRRRLSRAEKLYERFQREMRAIAD